MKSEYDDIDELSPDELQAAIAQKRAAEEKEAKFAAVGLKVFGGLAMICIIYLWYSMFEIGLAASLGLIAGVLAAGAFKIIYPEGINPKNNVQKIVVLIFGAGMIYLMNIQYAHEFTIMLLPSVLFASAMFGIIHVSAFSKPQT